MYKAIKVDVPYLPIYQHLIQSTNGYAIVEVKVHRPIFISRCHRSIT